jgi:hypothetical protein
MAELKTKKNAGIVDDFLAAIEDPQRRADCQQLKEIFEKITKQPATMWGDSIVGFGTYHYKYASGREGDWMVTGFSPRKQNLTLYIMAGFEKYPELMENLGEYKTGKSCLYLKQLSDAHLPTLKKLIRAAFKNVTETQQGC